MPRGIHMKGRKLPIETRKKMSTSMIERWRNPLNRKKQSVALRKVKNGTFKCLICKKNIVAPLTAHPKWCKICKKKVNRDNQRKYYQENKGDYLFRANSSQSKFIRLHGTSRNQIKKHGLTVKQYDEMAQRGCYVCHYKEVLDIHRLIVGSNKKIILMCPNHHALVHRKGFKVDGYGDNRLITFKKGGHSNSSNK